MTDFIKFPKIRQFRDIIKHVKSCEDFKGLDDEGNAIFEHTTAYPILKFEGTVKMHGTNAAIVVDENRKVIVQSRSRNITVEKDNAGFAAFVAGLPNSFFEECDENIAIFGEWCGGNIQKGVAINSLDKMFVIFAVKDLESDEWVDLSTYEYENIDSLNSVGVYYIDQFPKYEIEIDFNKPELAQAKLTEITEAVEAECPVGKHFDKHNGLVASIDLEGEVTFSYDTSEKVKSAAKEVLKKLQKESGQEEEITLE